MKERDYVVEFKLPDDEHLFIRHGTNVCAENPREAIARVAPFFPQAQFIKASEGVVMLYGNKFSTWDATLGAEYAPAK